MTHDASTVRQQLSLAHTEALKVGDSPLRADRVADQIQKILGELPSANLGDDRTSRISTSLEDALRVLRRDDDGREAAKHLQSAVRLLNPGQPRPSPFVDD